MNNCSGQSLPVAVRRGHGAGLRGASVNRGSRVFEGRFGRMFRTLPSSYFDPQKLKVLAQEMSAKPERVSDDPISQDYKKPAAAPEINKKIQDGEENIGIPAGYTYFGQFIDHDMTFDPASSIQKKNDPDSLIDFRTPALDLDCLYGRGPEDQPYMYDADQRKFLLGRELFQGDSLTIATYDLLRVGENKRAVIGDKRNDENVIVSQLQSMFQQFHNRLADDNPHLSFDEIQQLVQWHYQYVVLHDYLPKIVGMKVMDDVWKRESDGGYAGKPNLLFYHYHDFPYIPIEFSVAAYRFGHSMVRPIYRLNTNHDDRVDGEDASISGRFFIFAGVEGRGLNGFKEFPQGWAIDWSLFFDINDSANKVGKERVQPAYKIDTSLVNPLAFLPEFSKNTLPKGTALTIDVLQSVESNSISPSNLAIRNLLRGNSMGLPSGQDVARAMGLCPLSDSEIYIGKAQLNDDGDPDDKLLSDIEGGYFNGRAPLWVYILAESNFQWRLSVKNKREDEIDGISVSLGPVGGRIVAETIIGLLISDSQSYHTQFPLWEPTIPIAKERLSVGDIIKYALKL